MANPSCFIIMPISTPKEVAERCGGDIDHFKHVLECLISPAVKLAGYDPIAPSSTGSEIIHASIIRNLSDADMVLCDLSSLNPNVFYELGIRTSLNKPVAIIHDNHLEKIPFDTGIINVMKYESSLKAWGLNTDIQAISEHIKTTATKSRGKNPMWQYFGIPGTATLPSSEEASPAQVLEIVLSKLQTLERKIDTNPAKRDSDWTRANKISALEISDEMRKRLEAADFRQFAIDPETLGKLKEIGEEGRLSKLDDASLSDFARRAFGNSSA